MIEKFISFVEVYSFVGYNALKKHESSKNKRKEKIGNCTLNAKHIFRKKVNIFFNFGEIFFKISRLQIYIYLYLFSSIKILITFMFALQFTLILRKKWTMFYIMYS